MLVDQELRNRSLVPIAAKWLVSGTDDYEANFHLKDILIIKIVMIFV